MSDLKSTVDAWAQARAREMLAAPRMWGSVEAVELQLLLLVEIQRVLARPSAMRANPREVVDAYHQFLARRFGDATKPLFARFPDAVHESKFTEALSEFFDTMSRFTLAENPFEHDDLVLRLQYASGRVPTASSFAGYYAEFRRAARALARGSQRRGRANKHIEDVTDFVLEESRVTPQNGAPASVLLRLGTGGSQRDFDAETTMQRGLEQIATFAEWAATSEQGADLAIDDSQNRTMAATQVRRLLPRAPLERVEIGGKLMHRAQPIALVPSYEKRVVSAMATVAPAEPFDTRDEIRAIDLDRGKIRLRTDKLECFVPADVMERLTEVGVSARVRGDLYRPPGQKAFVFATSVEPDVTD